jgi:hypothetical protein
MSMVSRVAGTGRSLLTARGRLVGAAAACVTIAAFALATTAGANVQYNLLGTWDTYGTGGGYSGTFTISTLDKATGDFSGTGDNGMFVLKGTEFGTAVHFTQTEGTYVAHDDATLDLNNGKLEMINGNWSDSNGSNGTFTASIAYAGTISGTVTRYGGPLAGVTLTADNNHGDTATATSAADGTYTLNLPKVGTWTVTPSGLGLSYHPKDHIVFVLSDSTGVDFDGGGTATLDRDKVIPIPGSGTDLWYRGKDWDPTGSAVALTFGGEPFGSVQPSARSTIDGKITIPYWPHRATVSRLNNIPRRACWGDLVATQGTASASAEFSAKAVGYIVWSLSPVLHTGEVFCETETDSPVFKGPDTITYDFGRFISIYNGSQVIKGIALADLIAPHHFCYGAGSQPVHIDLRYANDVFYGVVSPGPCVSAPGTTTATGATGTT